jgi:hypothetical protein
VRDSIYSISLVSDLSSEKFGKKLLGESEVEDILHKLDRLTLDEARMTGTQTLQVVHGLVSNMKLVMDGTNRLLSSLPTAYWTSFVDRRTSMDDIRQARGVFSLQST